MIHLNPVTWAAVQKCRSSAEVLWCKRAQLGINHAHEYVLLGWTQVSWPTGPFLWQCFNMRHLTPSSLLGKSLGHTPCLPAGWIPTGSKHDTRSEMQAPTLLKDAANSKSFMASLLWAAAYSDGQWGHMEQSMLFSSVTGTFRGNIVAWRMWSPSFWCRGWQRLQLLWKCKMKHREDIARGNPK